MMSFFFYNKELLLKLLLLPLVLPTVFSVPDYDLQLFITSAGGFSDYFTDTNGTRYGMQFQNEVYTKRGGKRIGTNQGYSFWFPPDEFMMDHYNNTGQSESTVALFKMPTRTFFLIDGTITGVNEAIVGATGIYSRFQGGTMLENATGADPYEADIYLVLPASSTPSSSAGFGRTTSAYSVVNWFINIGIMSMAWSFCG